MRSKRKSNRLVKENNKQVCQAKNNHIERKRRLTQQPKELLQIT